MRAGPGPQPRPPGTHGPSLYEHGQPGFEPFAVHQPPPAARRADPGDLARTQRERGAVAVASGWSCASPPGPSTNPLSQATASSREVKNSCGYCVPRLVAAATTRSTALDPRTAMASTSADLANSYRAAALISTSVMTESIGIRPARANSAVARMASRASTTSTNEPGAQTDSMIPPSLGAVWPHNGTTRRSCHSVAPPDR